MKSVRKIKVAKFRVKCSIKKGKDREKKRKREKIARRFTVFGIRITVYEN